MSTMDTRRDMSSMWTGWIGFTAIMLALIGSITFFEGLVAVIRDEYYVVTGKQVLVFDLTTWGWIMLFWGVLLFLAGLGLAARSGWARWFAIIAGHVEPPRPARIPGQHAVPALDARDRRARDHGPLRAHGALGGGRAIRLTPPDGAGPVRRSGSTNRN